MVCSTAILSSSLALSLLRNSAPPSKSFVLSPFSLNTALSIVHDGAAGITQTELTNLLLNGCTASDVTDFYSSMSLSIPSTNATGVGFKSANRFYVDKSISLKSDYQKHVESKYRVKVENIDMKNTVAAANMMNSFVDEATNGMIKEAMSPEGLSGVLAILINAIHFLGEWATAFDPKATQPRIFKADSGEKKIDFMSRADLRCRVGGNYSFGDILIMPYKDETYDFFYIMPAESSTLEKMRTELTGDQLVSLLNSTDKMRIDVKVPKFKLKSDLDGAELLSKLGVNSLFSNDADLSKISATPLKVSKIVHKAMIEMDEKGTEAAAFTGITMVRMSAPSIVIDRPFLFGIRRNDDILFIGQFNG